MKDPSSTETEDPGALTYEGHFGLTEKPFSLSPNPRFFFRDAARAAAFSDLLAGIRRREGILSLTGSVGTGKTTLCRTVLHSLDRKTFSAFVPDPIVTREDLLKVLLLDFGIVSVDEIRAGHLRGAGRTDLSYPLYEFLRTLQPLKAFAVLIIDEAQNLPNALLEEIRILSELEHGEKLLQLVLVGQPEFAARLMSPEMHQLNQRISVRCELGPLSQSDVGAYVAHRLAVAGSRRPLFDEPSIGLITAASGGVPRVINLLCDRALARAARAAASKVAPDHVIGAAADLKIPQFAFGSWWWNSSAPEPKERDVSSDRVPHTDSDGPAIVSVLTQSPDIADAHRTSPVGQNTWLRGVAVTMMVLTGFAAALWGGRFFTTRPGPADRQPTGALTRTPVRSEAESRGSAPLSSATPPPMAGIEAESLKSRTVGAFLIQMATFETASRAADAVTQFEAAGHRASASPVVLRDGRSGFVVLLGPYADRASAEHTLQSAQQVPGYGVGIIIESVRPVGTP